MSKKFSLSLFSFFLSLHNFSEYSDMKFFSPNLFFFYPFSLNPIVPSLPRADPCFGIFHSLPSLISKIPFPLLVNIIPYPQKFPQKFMKQPIPSYHLIPSQQHISLFLPFFQLGFKSMEPNSPPSEKRKYNKRGKTLRFEPSNCNEITSFPFVKKCFEDVICLEFCQKV